MITIFQSIESVLSSYSTVLGATTLAFLSKSFIIYTVLRNKQPVATRQVSWYLFLLIIIGSMASDSAWILTCLEALSMPSISYLKTVWLQLCWGFAVVQYQALALFLESLVTQHSLITRKNRLFIGCSTTLLLFFILNCCIPLHNYLPWIPEPFIESMQALTAVYLFFPLMFTTIYTVLKTLYQERLPVLLKSHLRLVIEWCVVPILLCDIIQLYPFNFTVEFIASSYSVVSVSSLLLAYALYYCTTTILGIRFLKSTPDNTSTNLLVNNSAIKNSMEQLNKATTVSAVHERTIDFFAKTFTIAPHHIHCHFTTPSNTQEKKPFTSVSPDVIATVSTFLQDPTKRQAAHYLATNKVILYDELTFTNFYHHDSVYTDLLTLLETVRASIFIPLYHATTLIGFIIIDNYARQGSYFSAKDHDQISIFANYLEKIIHFLYTKKADVLIHKNSMLQRKLLETAQTIALYKESIKPFLTQHPMNTGVIIYKNSRFTPINPAGQSLIQLGTTDNPGHYLTKALKKISTHVTKFRGPYSLTTYDTANKKIILSATPNTTDNSIVITSSYPTLADTVDPLLIPTNTDWSSLVYLKNTQLGAMIDAFLPGETTTLTRIKTTMLSRLIQAQPLAILMPDEDRNQFFNQLLNVYSTNGSYLLDISTKDSATSYFTILFGGDSATKKPPLFQTLANSGLLLINNIHLLDHATQRQLLQYLKTGTYTTNDNQLHTSTVRLIGAIPYENPQAAVIEGALLYELYEELQNNSITLTPLSSYETDDLEAIIDAMVAQQAVRFSLYDYTLTSKHKKKILEQQPTTLTKLKQLVEKTLLSLVPAQINHDILEIDNLTHTTELKQIQYLGKKALKNRTTMELLWKFFKNQNQIALFLGVNRSSVNRRCKEYNFQR